MANLITICGSKKFEIKMAADKASANILLYGAIGASMWEDSISASDFAKEFQALPSTVKTLNVRINSIGGDVFDGITIYNRLKKFDGKVIVHVDGIAASIASIIAMAGEEIIMGEGTEIMIHKPWCFCGGNSNQLQETIDRLDEIEENMLGIYSRKTKLDRSELRSMLSKETWINAEDAVSMGFATKVEGDSVKIAAALVDKATWFKHKPKSSLIADQEIRSKINKLRTDVKATLDRSTSASAKASINNHKEN